MKSLTNMWIGQFVCSLLPQQTSSTSLTNSNNQHM